MNIPPVTAPACRRLFSAPGFRASGFSYIEVIVAVFLIAIVLVPASDLLSGALLGIEVHKDQSKAHHHLVAKMEEVLARPLSDLRQRADAAGSAAAIVTAYSDSAGALQRRLVFLSRYDADNADGDGNGFTGSEANLLWVKVQIEGTSLQAITLAGVTQ